MTKEEVIRTRNVLKCGKETPTAEDKPKLGRPIKIFGENGVQVLDELSSFVMWDDEHEIVYGIVRGNGINGGQIPQTAQAYGNIGWKSGGINGENFQLVAIPYVEIAAMCCAANMNHVEEFLNYYKSTLSGAAATAFAAAAEKYMKYEVRPLHDVETYVAGDIKDAPYPYVTPVWDEASQSWKNPDGTPAKVDRFGDPYPDPDHYRPSSDTTTMM